MFIDNKYTKWYYAIVTNAQTRAKSRKKAKEMLGYVESHHIIPRAAGGSNVSSNIAHLSAREHFICHRLLTKMTQGTLLNSMRKAVHRMCSSNAYQQRRSVTGRAYETIRKEFALACAATAVSRIGAANGMYGKKHSEESKALMSVNRKGKGTNKRSDETRQKQSAYQKGRPKSDQHKQAVKESWERTRENRIGENHPSYGKKRSDEAKAKMRAAWERRKQR